jgi:hypothetical protein
MPRLLHKQVTGDRRSPLPVPIHTRINKDKPTLSWPVTA